MAATQRGALPLSPAFRCPPCTTGRATGIVEPSVSPARAKLWSYADLMGLRVVYWLQHPRQSQNKEIAASPMSQVRRALDEMESRGLDIWGDSTDEPGLAAAG